MFVEIYGSRFREIYDDAKWQPTQNFHCIHYPFVRQLPSPISAQLSLWQFHTASVHSLTSQQHPTVRCGDGDVIVQQQTLKANLGVTFNDDDGCWLKEWIMTARSAHVYTRSLTSVLLLLLLRHYDYRNSVAFTVSIGWLTGRDAKRKEKELWTAVTSIIYIKWQLLQQDVTHKK